MKNTLAKKLRQVPAEYLVVGIDPHKKKHAAVAITRDFNTLAKFKFDNTRVGLETMLERARETMVKSNSCHAC
ncbi:transposase [Chloroflexota bacterium]